MANERLATANEKQAIIDQLRAANNELVEKLECAKSDIAAAKEDLK